MQAEADMSNHMMESTSCSDDEDLNADDLQNEVEMLTTDPEGPAEILPSKTRGKIIDFKLAEQKMNDEIKAHNAKSGLDPMEIEDVDDEYVEE